MTIDVKFKKLNANVETPKYANYGDACFDFVATEKEVIKDHYYTYYAYKTGIAMEIPEGHVGLIFPRSSVSKTSLTLANCVGVIDSCYRGEVMFKFRTSESVGANSYNVGDRIGQMMIIPIPHINLIETDSLSDSERGEGGFGSTGK